ncbi:HEAT repeat domain-containing protein [Paenibacillus sp. TAB 01]|uniref:HEAT repeat domain-containing protein n=1 Tax=Paenibacillus sp. TAB 01 TaxID=3368988 RepID=UPI003751C607
MQAAIGRFLGIRGEDKRKLWSMAPIFFCGGVAESLNYTAFMALFNLRFGVAFLPYVYLAEAAIMPLEGWLLAKLTGSMSKSKMMRSLYLLMTSILLLNGIILLTFKFAGLDFRYYYPILFLSSNFVVRQLTLLLWSVAFDLCPTQQAKRLMPLFVASTTTGGIAAGLIAHWIGSLLGTEAVYALAPLMLLAGFWPFRKAIASYLAPLSLMEEKHAAASAASGAPERPGSYFLKETLRSPFLLSAIALMTLMPALYFLMEYQYFTAAEARFPNERELTSFYGIITALQFTFCLLLQSVSGRLMNWLGASNMLLSISVIFFGGFVLTAGLLGSSFGLYAVSGSYALFYIFLYFIAEPCYQLFFKMMPLSERDGFRYFAQGIAASGGILIGSLLSLLHSSRLLELGTLAWVGVALAVLLLAAAWYGRHLYVQELVKSVQSLYKDISDSAASFFGNLRGSKTFAVMLDYLRHPDDYVREVALQLIGKANDSSFLPHLIALLADSTPRIRVCALRAMHLQGASIQDLVEIAALLDDEDFEVRAECVRLIAKASHMKSQAHFFLRIKLLDAHPLVVSEGVKALYALESEESYPACQEAIVQMLDKGGEWAVYGCRTVADLQLSEYAPWLMSLLEEPRPAVKVAAVYGLGKLGHLEAVDVMLGMYPMADKELRRAIGEALVEMGEPAVPLLLEGAAHPNPFTWNVCVTALARLLDEGRLQSSLIELAAARLLASTKEGALPLALSGLGHSELADLAAKRCKEIHDALCDGAWAVLGRLTDERVVASLRETIQDENEEVRENGLEILSEGFGDRRLAGALMELYKQERVSEQLTAAEPAVLLSEAVAWPDEWLARIAAYALDRGEGNRVKEERKFLSMMDKVMFMKQVPLFSNLSVDELGLLAGIAQEEVHPDQAYLLRRGDPSLCMYLIVDGTIELSNETEEGGGGTIGVLGPKDSLGETTALDGFPSSVTAQAIFDEVTVLALQGEQLSRLMRLYPEIGIGLLHASSARVRLLENMLLKMG